MEKQLLGEFKVEQTSDIKGDAANRTVSPPDHSSDDMRVGAGLWATNPSSLVALRGYLFAFADGEGDSDDDQEGSDDCEGEAVEVHGRERAVHRVTPLPALTAPAGREAGDVRGIV